MRLMTVPEVHRTVDAVWRLESARIIAGLARLVNDVGLAEELAQDALVAALKQWPESGIPPNPGAWLMATARHQAIDQIRRNERLKRKLEQLGHEFRQRQESAVFDGQPDFDAVIEGEGVQDDLLRLRRSPAPSCPPSRRSPSGSSGPSAPWPAGTFLSRSHRTTSAPRAWHRCSKSST